MVSVSMSYHLNLLCEKWNKKYLFSVVTVFFYILGILTAAQMWSPISVKSGRQYRYVSPQFYYLGKLCSFNTCKLVSFSWTWSWLWGKGTQTKIEHVLYPISKLSTLFWKITKASWSILSEKLKIYGIKISVHQAILGLSIKTIFSMSWLTLTLLDLTKSYKNYLQNMQHVVLRNRPTPPIGTERLACLNSPRGVQLVTLA